MGHSKLSHALSRKSGLSVERSSQLINLMSQCIQEDWKQGCRVNIPGVGQIQPKYLAPREVACNLPRAKHRYRIGMRKTAKLIPAPELITETDFGPNHRLHQQAVDRNVYTPKIRFTKLL